MKLNIIDKLETFEALKDNWNRIYEADCQAQFFISWPWIHAVLKFYCEQKMPWFILGVKLDSDASEYIGFLSLSIDLNEESPGNFYNTLSLVGVTDADYPGLLCIPEYEVEIISLFAQYIQQQETWSILTIENSLKSNKRANLLLNSLSTETFKPNNTVSEYYKDPLDNINNQIIPYVTLPDNWDDYLNNSLSSNTRQKIRRFLRKIENSDELYITDVNADNLEQHLEILTEFWRTSWESRKGKERCQAITKQMKVKLRNCFEHDCLYLPILWKRERPLGAIANILDIKKKMILFLAGGRDETFKELPTGFILHAYGIQYGIQNGFKVYDFLVGNEAYKYSFGAQERYIQTMVIRRKDIQNQRRKLDVRTIPQALEISQYYHRVNRLSEAEQGYEQILDAQPNQIEALYGLSVVKQRQGNYETAENFLKRLLEIQPNDIKAWFSFGNLYQIQGKLLAAEQAYQQGLALKTDSSPIVLALYHNLGYAFQQQEKWQEAIACYQKARELQPDSLEAEVMWANALDAQNQLSPDQKIHYAQINHDLGLKRKQAKDIQVAIAYFRQAIRLNPNLAETYYYLGLTLQQDNPEHLEEAIACYQTALKLKPDFLEVEVVLANLRYAQDKLFPDEQVHYAKVNYELGNRCEEAGDLKNTVEYYRQAITMNPELVEAYYRLGLTLQQQSSDHIEEAIACYQKALKLKPDFIEAEVMIANLNYAQENLSPDKQIHYANLNYELGNQYKQKGNLKIAIQYYYTAITLNPDLTEARKDLKLAIQEQDNVKIKVSCAKQ